MTIFNNEGNNRDLELGDVVDPRAEKRLKVTFKEPAQLQVVKSYCDGIKLERIDAKNCYVTVPGAQMVILTY